MTCAFCGKPIEPGKGVPMDIGVVMHVPCGLRSESGEVPPIARDTRGHGLFQFAPSPKR